MTPPSGHGPAVVLPLASLAELLEDPTSLVDRIAETDALAEAATSPPASPAARRAVLEELGSAATDLGLADVARACRELAGRGALGPADLQSLEATYRQGATPLRALASRSSTRISVARAEWQSLLNACGTGAPQAEIVERLRALAFEPAARWLERIGQHARAAAARAGRPPPELTLDAGGLRFDRAFWTSMFAALRGPARQARARLSVRTAIEDDRLVLELTHDGGRETLTEAFHETLFAETCSRAGVMKIDDDGGRGLRLVLRFPPVRCAAARAAAPRPGPENRTQSGLRPSVRVAR